MRENAQKGKVEKYQDLVGKRESYGWSLQDIILEKSKRIGGLN